MHHFHRALTLAGVLTLLLLPSCSKLREHIGQKPSDIGKYCPIQMLAITGSGYGYPNPTIHIKFFYDDAGRPIEIRQLDAGPYGGDRHFRYDKKGRLSDVLDTDPGQTFVYIWSRYSYPSPHTIIDSTYEYQGNVNDPAPPNLPGLNINILVIHTDAFGRAVQFTSSSTFNNAPPYTFDLAYDTRGNQVVDGNYVYDDKINIYQTSPTWQLVYNNYSRNNLTAPPPTIPYPETHTPAAYNKYGLPTKFLGPFGTFFGFGPFTSMDVTYACDAPTTLAP